MYSFSYSYLPINHLHFLAMKLCHHSGKWTMTQPGEMHSSSHMYKSHQKLCPRDYVGKKWMKENTVPLIGALFMYNYDAFIGLNLDFLWSKLKWVFSMRWGLSLLRKIGRTSKFPCMYIHMSSIIPKRDGSNMIFFIYCWFFLLKEKILKQFKELVLFIEYFLSEGLKS